MKTINILKNRIKFRQTLAKMLRDFIDENKVVSIGDQVISSGYPEGVFEITDIDIMMTSEGSWIEYAPTLFYYALPVSKSGKAMKSRKLVHLHRFTQDKKEYVQNHICFQRKI